jgi:hypothetical protein
MPHLCERMRRLTTKDSGARKKAEEEKTPDLASISKENPLPDDIPMLPAAVSAGSGGMDYYLTRLSENGGVDNYLSSLSDNEIGFLARRQMLRQADMFAGAPNPLLMGDPSRAPSLNPGMFGVGAGMDRMQGLMGPNPGMIMSRDPQAAAYLQGSARMPMAGVDRMGGSLGTANMAAMQGGPLASSMSPARKLPAGMMGGPNPRMAGFSPQRNPMAANPAARFAQGAGRGGAMGAANPDAPRGQPGNPAIDQFLNRASDNELAQLIAMHDAAAVRRRQMPPF